MTLNNNIPLLSTIAPSFSPRHLDFTPPEGWHALNPSVVLSDGQLLTTVRTVNFVHRCPHSKELTPTTRNFLLTLNPDLTTKFSREICLPADFPVRFAAILGVEDLRPFVWLGALWVIGCTAMLSGRPEQILARVAPESLTDCRVLQPPCGIRPQKNWMPQVSADRLRFLYWHNPTTILDEWGALVSVSEPPVSTAGFRGSTQLVPFDDGWLGMIHEVLERPNETNYYFHRFVWLNAEDKLRAVSRRFRFSDRHVDYCAGLSWHPDGERMVLSFAVCDVEAWLATVEAAEVRAMLEPCGPPPLPWEGIVKFLATETNQALRAGASITDAAALVQMAGWPRASTREKSWDDVLGVGYALTLPTDARILDAGADIPSPFLGALRTAEFTVLTGINTKFAARCVIDGVIYEPGDITATRFPDAVFDYIGCLSVIEHEVDVPRFLAEMARILVLGARLFVSFDYWETPMESGAAFIFDRAAAEGMIAEARCVGLEVVGSVDLSCRDRVIRWGGLDYTFANLLFEKVATVPRLG